MLKWEYNRIDLNDIPLKTHALDLFNDAGEDGWELVTITTNNIAFLKRPIAPPPPAKATRRKAGAPSSAEIA